MALIISFQFLSTFFSINPPFLPVQYPKVLALHWPSFYVDMLGQVSNSFVLKMLKFKDLTITHDFLAGSARRWHLSIWTWGHAWHRWECSQTISRWMLFYSLQFIDHISFLSKMAKVHIMVNYVHHSIWRDRKIWDCCYLCVCVFSFCKA